MEDVSLREMVQRTSDYQEIQNVMAAHSYYYEAQKNRNELDDIWSKRDDIAYGERVGREAVIQGYGEASNQGRKAKLAIISKIIPDVKNVKENEGIGDMVIKLLTTPYIVIAGDGKTAKGLWFSPSICAELGSDGEPVVASIWEKVETDFIKEDGHWKIWHYRQWPEFIGEIDKSFVDGSKGFPGHPILPGIKPPDKPKESTATPQPYSAKRVAKFVPKLPQPYEFWDDSMSCVKN